MYMVPPSTCFGRHLTPRRHQLASNGASDSHAMMLSCRLVRALDKAMAAEDKAADKDLQTLRASYIKALGFDHWHRLEQANLRNHFPTAYPLF